MRKVLIVLAFAALLFGLTAVAPTPARAAWNACPDGRFCMWENTNYWGTTSFVWPVQTVCYGAESWVSSVRNRMSAHVHIYTNGTCTGTGYDLYPGQSAANMTAFGGDNNMRSYKVF
jgi:hypothetical protein